MNDEHREIIEEELKIFDKSPHMKKKFEKFFNEAILVDDQISNKSLRKLVSSLTRFFIAGYIEPVIQLTSARSQEEMKSIFNQMTQEATAVLATIVTIDSPFNDEVLGDEVWEDE